MSRRLDPLVCHLVDGCPFTYSNRSVIRSVVSRLVQGHASWRALPRRKRRKLLRDIIYRHYQNRHEYRAVMVPGAGRRSQTRPA
jgi:hypothetical protein